MRDERRYDWMEKGDFLEDVSPDEEVVISQVSQYDSLMDYAAGVFQDTGFRPVYEFEDDQGFGLMYEASNSAVALSEMDGQIGITHFRFDSSVDGKAETVRRGLTEGFGMREWEDIELGVHGNYGPDQAAVKLSRIIEQEK